jgi:hypothetical protein
MTAATMSMWIILVHLLMLTVNMALAKHFGRQDPSHTMSPS